MRSTNYTPEFRAEAVKLVLVQGQTLEEAAKRIAIPRGTLANWVLAAKRGTDRAAPPGKAKPGVVEQPVRCAVVAARRVSAPRATDQAPTTQYPSMLTTRRHQGCAQSRVRGRVSRELGMMKGYLNNMARAAIVRQCELAKSTVV